MGCCGSKGSAGGSGIAPRSNASAGRHTGTAISAMGADGAALTHAKRPSSTKTGKKTAISSSGGGGGSGAAISITPQEQYRARSREKAIHALVESLKDHEQLVPALKWRRQYIKVAGIGSSVASALASHLQSAPHGIVTLDLRAMKIGDEGLQALAPVVFSSKGVENVMLPGNQLTDEGVKSLVMAISGPKATASPVKLLVLCDNPITSAGVVTLAACLSRLPALERLELGRGQVPEELETEGEGITEEAVAALVRLFEASDSLKTFVVRGTGSATRTDFTPAGLASFVIDVVAHSRLNALFLQECFTTKPTFAAMSVVADKKKGGASQSPVHVTTGHGDAKAYLQPIAALATALTQRTTQLSTLVLRFPLNDAAVGLLCGGLSQAAVLANLSLRGCDMSAAGLRQLGDALRNNRTISALDISYQSRLIAHPVVLAELRSSSKRRLSFAAVSEWQDSLGSSGADSMPSREEREHPLLPIIQVLHTNRIITQLVMLGVNISTDDIEELCSCMEQSNNHVLTDVAYTSIGVDALNMKLESFLSANRKYGVPSGQSAASQRGMGRRTSSATLFGDTMTERSMTCESPGASPALDRGGGGGGYHSGNTIVTPLSCTLPALAPHYVAHSRPGTPTQEDHSGPGSSLPSLLAPRQSPAVQLHHRLISVPAARASALVSPNDVELRVQEEESSEAGTAPYLSRTGRQGLYGKRA